MESSSSFDVFACSRALIPSRAVVDCQSLGLEHDRGDRTICGRLTMSEFLENAGHEPTLMSGHEQFPTTVASLLNALHNQQDSAAWRQFSSRYADVLVCYCRRRGLQQADAEDISQQVLFAVSRQISNFQQQPDRGLFRSWLATIAIRAIWKQRRQSCRTSAGSLQDCEQLAEPSCQSWLADFNAAVLDASLNRICPEFTAEEWTAFCRVWQADEPCLEVAADICKSASWVYRTKYRILDRLKREIAVLAEDSAILSS